MQGLPYILGDLLHLYGFTAFSSPGAHFNLNMLSYQLTSISHKSYTQFCFGLLHWHSTILTHWTLRQNGCHFPDDTLKCFFLNQNVSILIKISLRIVPKGSINNIPALVQIMAWRQLGDKPLSEPMMISLLTHTCVTRPQWVNCPSADEVTLKDMGKIHCYQNTKMYKLCIKFWGILKETHRWDMIIRSSHLYKGNSYTGYKAYLYWIKPFGLYSIPFLYE